MQERSDWRVMISLQPDLANDIKTLAHQLGINYQAVMKVLMDEALRARKANAKRDGE
jgi:predicted DNA binding CopG/RHH family protein